MLERFFSGVLSQLQAEIDTLNALVPHYGERGALNEESLRRVLTRFLPNRYAIGTGFVIDSFGSCSRQVDLLIYDDWSPPRLFNAVSQMMFPVETVFACIEVKTTAAKQHLVEIADENKVLSQLKHYVSSIQSQKVLQGEPMRIALSTSATRPPLALLVAYRSSTDNPLTVRRWFEEFAEPQYLPDIALFLDLSMLVLRTKEGFDFILITLRDIDIGGATIHPLFYPHPLATVPHNGRMYHSSRWKSIDGGYPLLMPERALLGFLVELARVLDELPKHASFDATHYLREDGMSGLDVVDNEHPKP